MSNTVRNAGFTLVELAIVLVIIGLLVGGVLVGQDLIKQAEIRSVVDQMEKTNAAVNTFRGKFGGFPGDLASNRAVTFGLNTGVVPVTDRDGTDGRGDGDGLVEGHNGTAVTANALGGESALFWRDLSTSDLISEGFSTTTGGPAVSATLATLPDFVPQTRLRESTFISVLNSAGRNNYYIDQISSTNATGVITSTGNGLSPLESKSIDEKLDDGIPISGTIIATTGLLGTGINYTPDAGAAVTAGTSSPNACVNTSTTPDDYNVQELDQNIPNCALVVRASF